MKNVYKIYKKIYIIEKFSPNVTYYFQLPRQRKILNIIYSPIFK